MYQKKSSDDELARLSDPIKAKGNMLAGFLNMAEPVSSARILRIVKLLRTAEKFKSSGLPSWEEVDGAKGITAFTCKPAHGSHGGASESEWPGFQTLHEANEALKRYRPRLVVRIPTKDNPEMRSRSHHDTNEAQAAYWLVSVVEAGQLGFLRQCEVCKELGKKLERPATWFFAARPNQINCKGCGRRRYARTPFYKARARLNAKISYWEGRRLDAVTQGAKEKAREKIKVARQELEKLKESRS